MNTELANTTSLTPADADAPKMGDNKTDTKRKFYADIKKLGEEYGKGLIARTSLALRVIGACRQLDNINKGAIKDFYQKFQEAVNEAKGTTEFKEHASQKQQISKLTQFVIVADNLLVDAEGLFYRAKDIIRKESLKGEDSQLKGSMYDNLVDVFRAQKKVEDRDLTDDEIKAVIIKEDKPKDAMKKLIEQYKKLEKLHSFEDMPRDCLPSIENALYAIEEAFVFAGGDKSELTAKKGKGRKAKVTDEGNDDGDGGDFDDQGEHESAPEVTEADVDEAVAEFREAVDEMVEALDETDQGQEAAHEEQATFPYAFAAFNAAR